MANSDLIKGEATVRQSQGFVDYGKQFKGTGNTAAQSTISRASENEAKMQQVQTTVNNAMGKMKNNLDLTGFKPEEQKAMRSFLIGERNKYAAAASELGKLNDASDPDYQYYVDVMNGVNNSFTNLSAQVNAYKQNKIEFADGYNQGMYSSGNDGDLELENMSIMGFGDNVAPLYIGEGGNLGFETSKGKVSFNDYQPPFMKDYDLASSLATTANSLHKSHTPLSPSQENVIRLGLQKSLGRPNALKSIVSEDFSDDGFVFDGIDINAPDAKEQVIGRIMEGYRSTAQAGYNEYQARTNKGGGKSSGRSKERYYNTREGYTNNKEGSIASKLDAVDNTQLEMEIYGFKVSPSYKPVMDGDNQKIDKDGNPMQQRVNGMYNVSTPAGVKQFTYQDMLNFMNA